MSQRFFSDNEKDLAKKAGKVYLNVIKVMGVFFVLSLILSAVAVGDAAPNVTEIHLDSGESVFLPSFYAENGEQFQFAFGIQAENGQDYNYPETDGPFEAIEFIEQSEWLVTMQLYRADNLAFENAELVADISGEANIIQLELAQGFYKLKMTNNHESATYDIIVGRAHANLGLVIAAVGSWTVFGMAVGLFSAMVHIGFWILVIYMIVKIVIIYNEDYRRHLHYSQQYHQQTRGQIIQPPHLDQQSQPQQNTEGPLPHEP